MIAEGSSVNGTWTALEAAKAPPPRGVVWQRNFIRERIFDDVYKPHSFEEVASLVSAQVASRLDPERSYGVWWYNRRAAQRTRVLDERLGGERRYVTRTRYTEKPREEWIAVPVPDAGIAAEDVERARNALRHNEKSSSAGRRFWELSGGILRCSQCGRALVAVTTLKGPKRRRRRMFYYVCATRRQRGKHACSFSKSMNAQKAETAVWDAVSDLLTNPRSLKSDLEAMIEREKETRGEGSARQKH